jgi:hypothetical protein
MDTTELADRIYHDPRFLTPGSILFNELADQYGDDNVGLAYMQALIRARNEGLPRKGDTTPLDRLQMLTPQQLIMAYP